jgi:hypothetical protein
VVLAKYRYTSGGSCIAIIELVLPFDLVIAHSNPHYRLLCYLGLY